MAYHHLFLGVSDGSPDRPMQRWHEIISGTRVGDSVRVRTQQQRPRYLYPRSHFPVVEIFPCYRCTTNQLISRFEISPGRCELYSLSATQNYVDLTASGLYP